MPRAVKIPSPESFGRWVVQRREELGFRTREDFIQFAQESDMRLVKNTIRSIERGERSFRRVDVLEALAGLLRLPYKDILRKIDESLPSLDAVITASSTIGKQLVEHVREYPQSVPDLKLDHIYQALMHGEFRPLGISVDQFMRELHRETTRKQFAHDLPVPDMVITVDNEFNIISFQIKDGPYLRVRSPKLLWDCVCQASKKKGKNPDCPIHSQVGSMAITDVFRKGLIEIQWRGLRILWKQEKDFWPPSVDAFHFIENLKIAGIFEDRSIKSVLDIGCGTGFLAIACAVFSPTVNRLDLSDWLPTPLLYSAINFENNKPVSREVDLALHLGIHVNWPWNSSESKKKYDLVICNPPYLPIVECFRNIGLESTVAGTDLIHSVIENATRVGRRVFIQYSNIADNELPRQCDIAGVKLKNVGLERKVPFRIRFALENNEYMQWLISERGLKHEPKTTHKYWHWIRTYEVVARR